jgi:hypothetical protein
MGVSIKAEEWVDINGKGSIIVTEKLDDRDHEAMDI